MVNSYCYNRKTLQEDEAILSAVRLHHKKVKAELKKLGIDFIVMTSLVGSQNYDLDDKDSDIDTFTFFFPKIDDLMLAAEPRTYEYEMPDGMCYVKDIRTAFNLLKKTSPNSVEYFASKYKIYEDSFKDILEHYLNDNTYLYPMVHCNYKHMLMAIAGMAHQLTKRNMPSGKRYAHSLRLMDMRYHFIESLNATSILEMRPGGDVELALKIKRDTDESNFHLYEEQAAQIAGGLRIYSDNYEVTPQQKEIEVTGKLLIYSAQEDLFKRYITLNKDTLMETNV